MRVIAVDDERFALRQLEAAVRKALPDSTLSCFDAPSKALSYAEENAVDAAFLDIEMGGMSGLRFAKRLKDIRGKTNVVFVTGHSRYALDAFALHASGYIIKPVTAEAVAEAVEYLRHPVLPAPAAKRLRAKTFGNFEVFVDGLPLRFARTKTKELFAYLVSRQGALCQNDEVIAVIWEDRLDTYSLKAQFRMLVSDLTKTLNAAGLRDAVVKRRGAIAVAADKISCDMYDFCAGIGVNSYMGEFMRQYDWADFMCANLDRISDRMDRRHSVQGRGACTPLGL